MARDPNQEFVCLSHSRAYIATELNDQLEVVIADHEDFADTDFVPTGAPSLTPEDDRLTDEFCTEFAANWPQPNHYDSEDQYYDALADYFNAGLVSLGLLTRKEKQKENQ